MRKSLFFVIGLLVLPVRFVQADSLFNIVSHMNTIVESQLKSDELARKHLNLLLVQTQMLATYSRFMNLKNLGMIVYVGPDKTKYEFTPDFVAQAIKSSATDLLPMEIWREMAEKQRAARATIVDLNRNFGLLSGYNLPLLPNESLVGRLSFLVEKFGQHMGVLLAGQAPGVRQGLSILTRLDLPAHSKEKVMGFANSVSTLMFQGSNPYMVFVATEIQKASKDISRILIDMESRMDVSERIHISEQRLKNIDAMLTDESATGTYRQKIHQYREAYAVLSQALNGETDCLKALMNAKPTGT